MYTAMSQVIQKIFNHVPVKRDFRLMFLLAIFFLMSVILIFRLFSLQIIEHKNYTSEAERLHLVEKEIQPLRGKIYAREKEKLYPIVYNQEYFFAYVDPRKIEDHGKFIDVIAPILHLEDEDWKDLLRRIKKIDDPYEPVKRKVSREQVEQLKKLQIEGLSFTPEMYRKYPDKQIGGHVLGYVDYSGIGRYGLEGYHQNILSGLPGKIRAQQDAFGLTITIGERIIEKPVPGKDLVLTIDKNIQVRACQEIQKGVEQFGSEGGTVIVMEPQTGKIIAMCSFPDFDPENYQTIQDITLFNNPAIFYAYEPGSIFKVITMAIGLDVKKISPESTYEDTGEIKIIGHNPIKNFDQKAHGFQTMTAVLEKSLNTGAVHVEQLIGKQNFVTYVKDFGFGEITGLGLSTESRGNILSLDKKGEIYAMTSSFGQGITVTPIQFITAFSSLINGGKLLKPYIVEKVINEDQPIEETEPVIARQVISQHTSALISGMMVSVVEKGWDQKTKIAGYYVGGKTGTAQVVGTDGKYGEKTIHSFAGFAPAYNPRVAVLVKLDDPQKHRFASETATHVFRNIAEYILQYYTIPPDR